MATSSRFTSSRFTNPVVHAVLLLLFLACSCTTSVAGRGSAVVSAAFTPDLRGVEPRDLLAGDDLERLSPDGDRSQVPEPADVGDCLFDGTGAEGWICAGVQEIAAITIPRMPG
jgi:hypothetical protein